MQRSLASRAAEPNVDLALYVTPFLCGAKERDELLKRRGVGGSVLEPRQKVERLTKITRLIQAPRHCGQVPRACPNMHRSIFKDPTAFVLRQRPPCRRFRNRNERGTLGFRTAEGLLDCDQRLVLIYGKRVEPFGIRVRISADSGRTWSDEKVLRQDGGSWDLGYPRVVEHEKGKLLSVYYMNLKNDPTQMGGGVRHIAQTIFTPD